MWIVFLPLCGQGQDPNFSQYFSSPLTLNPAHTGFFDGEHRVASNFRQQSLGSGTLFRTATVSWDTKLLTEKIDEWDTWGFGLLALTDQSSGGAYRSNYLSLSTAYRKTLDEDGLHSLGIGFQATYANRFIDMNKLSFASQFTSGGFDMALPTGEQPIQSGIQYIDVQAGALYAYRSETFNAYVGGSVYHLTQPRQSFYEDQLNRLRLRSSLHAGAGVLQNGQQFMVSGLFATQGGAQEIAIGGAYGYPLGMDEDDKFLQVGAWYRWNDAWYPYIGLQWNAIQGGISYDVQTSSWSGGGAPRSRSIELSLIYHFRRDPDARYKLPCSRF